MDHNPPGGNMNGFWKDLTAALAIGLVSSAVFMVIFTGILALQYGLTVLFGGG
jgi:hypothetical protein